ncbi:MAG: sel1 repeat family protein [Bradyrhizobiaceae bacterium]|nr:sel1 repeat family protein [Bradyrhizobiaceae bacterium]
MVKLDPDRVPRPLVRLVPMAEKWGIDDDYDRACAVRNASLDELEALVHCIDDVTDDDLFGWLSGSEADRQNPSPEYIAFSDLTMAIDLARLRLERLRKKWLKAWEEGQTLYDAGRISEALEVFKAAAENGDPAGYIGLALIEDDQGNDQAALNWMRKVQNLAEQGGSFANLACSLALQMGRGSEGSIEEQEQKARFFMRRSAELGNPVAQTMLAQRVLWGLNGEPRNEQEYEIWISRAIRQGLDEAVITHVKNRLHFNRAIEPALMKRLEELAMRSEHARELLGKVTRRDPPRA